MAELGLGPSHDNNSCLVLSVYYVPEIVLSTQCFFSHLIFIATYKVNHICGYIEEKKKNELEGYHVLALDYRYSLR